jgi:type II secretory pathway pseudopilin PulG
MNAPRDLCSDAGETLVETLVALVILSLAAVAILAGIQLSTMASDIHRKQSTGGAYARSYAEAIEKYVSAHSTDNYKPCAAADAYNLADVTGQLNLPSGYEAHHAPAVPLTPTGAPGSCPGPDEGVQQLDLTVKSADERAVEKVTVILRRSCDPSAPC